MKKPLDLGANFHPELPALERAIMEARRKALARVDRYPSKINLYIGRRESLLLRAYGGLAAGMWNVESAPLSYSGMKPYEVDEESHLHVSVVD